MSITHILIVLLVLLILFGSKKIPEFMKGIGKGIHEFKKATNNLQDDLSKSSNEDDSKKSSDKKS